MDNGLTDLEKLQAKSIDLVKLFADLPEKDIRKKHLEILSTQISVSLINLKINYRFSETNKEEFEKLLDSKPENIDNYIFHFKQNIIESIIDAALFQTELIFRFYYGKLTGKTPGEERSLHKIIAILFDDVENNWSKKEAQFMILFWTLRNTIHTGGIYFHKPEGITIKYNGQDYKFEYGKAPEFLKEGYSLTLVSDLLDYTKLLFDSELIKNLGSYDHPSYEALGYNATN